MPKKKKKETTQERERPIALDFQIVKCDVYYGIVVESSRHKPHIFYAVYEEQSKATTVAQRIVSDLTETGLRVNFTPLEQTHFFITPEPEKQQPEEQDPEKSFKTRHICPEHRNAWDEETRPLPTGFLRIMTPFEVVYSRAYHEVREAERN